MTTGAKRGRTFEVPRRILHDEQTGREVWQISAPDTPSVAPYMYVTGFTPDERCVLYAAGPAKGMQLHRCEIASGETTQLTDRPGVPALGANLHPNGRELFYRANGVVYALDVETLEERVVLDPADHPEIQEPGEQIMFSRSGRYFSFSYPYEEGRRAIARGACDGSGYETVYRYESGTQHLMFCPASDDLMTFSPAPDHQQEWDLPDIERSRTYLLDVREGEIEPFICLPKPFTATHDYWSPGGDRMYFHKKTRPDWVPTWICALDRRTREEKTLFGSDTIKLGHSMVNREETHIVSDCQEPGRNELLWIDIAAGAAKVLCWPNSSVAEGQHSHVHPSISPLGSYVLYTSDGSGIPQVYLVPLR